MHQQTPGLNKTLPGKEHPCTLASMSSPASMCWKQGHLGEAAQLEVGVMEARTRLPELEHPNILRSIPNVAYTW